MDIVVLIVTWKCKPLTTDMGYKEWEVEYMTMFMKIQEEREDAQIEQLIESYRDLEQSDDAIISKLVSKFHLTKEEAIKRVQDYDLQPA